MGVKSSARSPAPFRSTVPVDNQVRQNGIALGQEAGSPLESVVSFRQGDRFAPITDMCHLALHAASTGPHWTGVHLELGASEWWDGEDLMASGHFLTMNRHETPINFLIRDESTGKWEAKKLSPGAFWIHPEGGIFSLRMTESVAWTSIVVDGWFLDDLLGGHHELQAGFDVHDPLLEALFRAMMAELLEPSQDRLVAQSVIASFVRALGCRHGHRADDMSASSRLDKAALDKLSTWLSTRLDTSLTVVQMADLMNLSVAHFSREFKRATGRRPWEYVIEMRVNEASRLLNQGLGVAAVAIDCGFFDQAHLSRAFKKQFGVPPSLYAKEAKVTQHAANP